LSIVCIKVVPGIPGMVHNDLRCHCQHKGF
jgi:hypothetical protein